MDKEKQPKERIVFDEDTYDDEFWHDICTYWQNQQEEFWEPYDPDSPDDYLMADLIREDYENEMAALTAFFDTGKSDMSSFENPLAGNPVIVSGTVGRWDGEHRGYSPFKSLKDALDTSSSRLGLGNPLADCEIQKVWDENGHLFVHGAHHDGSVTIEVRQLTDDGAAALEAIEDAWVGEPFTAGGKSYDGSMQSVNQAMRDLWDDPTLAPLPRYMEQSFGCPAEEWVQPEAVEVKTPEVSTGRSVGKATASVSLSDAAKKSRSASQALAGDNGHDDRVQDTR